MIATNEENKQSKHVPGGRNTARPSLKPVKDDPSKLNIPAH